jgi:NADH-quinone oxidoreductase subunit L
VTFLTFAVGALALIGCPPFSGFFSKDAILALAYEKNGAIFAVGLFTALLTAFYVTRLLVVVFLGHTRTDAARSSHEAPLVMVGPLIILAGFSAVAGFGFFAQSFLPLPHEAEKGYVVPALAILALILGAGSAIVIYRGRDNERFDFSILRHRFYIDEFYRWLINVTQETLASICNFIDRWVLDAGAVRGASGGTWGLGAILRYVQVGNLQAYVFIFGLGLVALIFFTLFH